MDHAATTYLDDAVMDAMRPFFKNCFGNPSSLYESGRSAKSAMEAARKSMARLLGVEKKNEIFFTSGGTESNNWAIKGAALAADTKRHIVTAQTEHPAVLNPCRYLEKKGYEITYIPPDRYGMVTADDVARAMREDTLLVSVMYANNEVGTINPVAEIGKVVRSKGAFFHTDAVQAAGVLPIDVEAMNIDMLSLSAHKFYGPKGVGVLYVRNGIPLESLLQGGGQERERRAGTENVPLIVGMAEALRQAYQNAESENRRLTLLRDHMVDKIKRQIPGVRLNGHPLSRLPGNVNMTFESVQAQISLVNLDMAGIECSSGSACSSGSIDPSHVLMAMGASQEEALCALRFTLGRCNTRKEVEAVVEELVKISARIRGRGAFAE
jgi:cysteine desulfurase